MKHAQVQPISKRAAAAAAPRSERSSFAKVLSILDLFDEGCVRIEMDDVAHALGTARATTYRYLRALCDAGLLSPSGGGVYILGPRIVEFDRLMRISDPLLTAGSKVMREVSAKRGRNMLLARYFRDSIMCVDIAWPDESIPADFERGLPMSLFRGAMAKIILAHLSPYQLRNVALHHADEIRRAGLGDTWPEFRARTLELARQGYAVTRAEMRPHGGGISAPIFHQEKILGSITFVVSDEEWDRTDFEKLRVWITDAATRITAMIVEAANRSEAHAFARSAATNRTRSVPGVAITKAARGAGSSGASPNRQREVAAPIDGRSGRSRETDIAKQGAKK